MKKIVIFAGTTEGRRLSEILADAGIAHTVCVATDGCGGGRDKGAATRISSPWQNGPAADGRISA